MSGTDFLIEVEQRMKGTSAVTELTQLEDSFTSAKARYAEFSKANEAAAKSLDKMAAQILDARAKLSKATENGDAKAAEKATASLAKLVGKQSELKANADKVKTALDGEAKSLTAIADRIGGLKDAGGGLDAKDVGKAGKGLKALGGPLGDLGAKVAKVTKGWNFLSGSLGEGGAIAAVAAAGVVLVVAAVAALAVAAIVAGAKVALWAIGLADTRRELDLTLEAMGGSKAAGDALGATFDDLQRSTGLGADRLLELTRQLKAAHVSASNLPAALKGLAEQESALGDSSGTAALVEQLKAGSISANKLAGDMDRKFGSVVAKRMLGLSEQTKTFGKNVQDVFGSVDIEPILQGVAKLGGLLDVSTESGKGLRAVFQTLFAPLTGSTVTDVFTAIERAILTVELYALSAAVALKKMTSGTDLSGLAPLYELVKSAAWAEFSATITFIGAVIVSTVASFLSFLEVVSLTVSAAIAAKDALVGLIESVTGPLEALPSKFATMADDIVDGFVGRIVQRAVDAQKAVADLAHGVVNTVKGVLETHSPSRVFADIGGDTVDGYVGGVDDNAPKASSAVERLVAPPSSPSGGGGSSSKGADLSGATFNFYGVKDAESAQASMLDALTSLLEGEGAQTATEAPA